MRLLPLALKSLANRRATVALTVIGIALSVALLLGVEKVRTGAKLAFANTVSGTDLIVGARTGPVQLLLYSVFRIGAATNTISWESYQALARLPRVAWTVPLALGDSHEGSAVVGTTVDYFEHFRYGRKQPLAFAAGGPFSDLFDAVLGADVARVHGYKLGDRIELAHGMGEVALQRHEDRHFRVSGILAPTGTPVDRSVHVSLEGIEAIHADWVGGVPVPGARISEAEIRAMDLTPKQVTAVLVGLDSPRSVLAVQRAVNNHKGEPLLAILPGVTLQELWDMMGVAERALVAVSALVVATGLLGLVTTTLAGLNERRREMAILRSVGASPRHVFGLMMFESGLLAVIGALAGVALLYLGLVLAQPVIESRFGLHIAITAPSAWEGGLLAAVVLAGIAAGAVPAYRAYRYSLADGMMART